MNTKQYNLQSVGSINISKNPRAKRCRISIRTDGVVRVTIPMHLSYDCGKQFAEQNIDWINKTKEKISRRDHTPKRLLPGPLFSTRNYHYIIRMADVSRLRVQIAGKNLYFEIPYHLTIEDDNVQQDLTVFIENVLRFEAKHYLPGRTAQLATEMGYSFNKVTIKNNKTNWGSCSNKNNINLNLHLMRLKDELIDYVIIHELIHTKIPNHGPLFHSTLLSHLTNKVQLEQVLKSLSTTIL